MAGWWEGHLMCVQMTADPDRTTLLSEYVKKWPGCIAVSRPRYGYSLHTEFKTSWDALDNMIQITKKPYGWIRILALGFAHTFTGGRFYPNVPNGEETKWPPVCSESYSRAMRLSGMDLVPERPDCRTEPYHLFTAKLLKPMFVLV
jgi:hypothetical protein